MRRSFLLFCLLADIFHSATASAQMSDERVARIVKSVGTAALEEGQLVGLSVGVATTDRTVCVVSFGSANAEHEIPVADNTVFRIGSVSKMFTAAAVLLLVEDGKIELENPVSEYLPDYPLPGAKATVLQLLQHTSGIADLTRQPTFRKNHQVDLSRQEVLDSFKDLPLEFSPGQRYRYCNSGYLLLAQIVEAVAEKPFEKFVEERLLRPAGLTQTVIDNQDTVIKHRASGYSRWGGRIRVAPHVSLKISTGAGNMASTVADLLRWKQALINGEIISRSSFDRMTTPGRLADGRPFRYGLGAFVQMIGARRWSDMAVESADFDRTSRGIRSPTTSLQYWRIATTLNQAVSLRGSSARSRMRKPQRSNAVAELCPEVAFLRATGHARQLAPLNAT